MNRRFRRFAPALPADQSFGGRAMYETGERGGEPSGIVRPYAAYGLSATVDRAKFAGPRKPEFLDFRQLLGGRSKIHYLGGS